MADDDSLMFEATIARNAARLTEVTARWIRGMSEADKDKFLESALDIAFHRRGQYDPVKHCITLWFAECLGQAARRRRHWRVWRQGQWQQVLPQHLEVRE